MVERIVEEYEEVKPLVRKPSKNDSSSVKIRPSTSIEDVYVFNQRQVEYLVKALEGRLVPSRVEGCFLPVKLSDEDVNELRSRTHIIYHMSQRYDLGAVDRSEDIVRRVNVIIIAGIQLPYVANHS